MFADGVEQTRKQKFARSVGAGKKSGNKIAGAFSLPFLTGKRWRINESTIGLVTVEKTFFEEAIEGGHYGGVSERTAQLENYVANAALTALPEDFHQLVFEASQCQRLVPVCVGSSAMFQEAHHFYSGSLPLVHHDLLVIGACSSLGLCRKRGDCKPPEEKFKEKIRQRAQRHCIPY